MSIRFTKCIEEANAITHGGNFHADDVFSIVLIEKLFKKVILFRSADHELDYEKISPDTIIFDVGHGKFDHHQKGGNGFHSYTNGAATNLKPIPYATFGLLWKEYGMEICLKYTKNNYHLAAELWADIEINLVQGIDAIDNGIFPSAPKEYEAFCITAIPNVISLLNPIDENSLSDYINALREAIHIAKFFFETKIQLALYKLRSNSINTKSEFSTEIDAEKIFIKVLNKKLPKQTTTTKVACNQNITTMYYNDIPRLTIPQSTLGKIWDERGKDYCNSLHMDDKFPDYIWNFMRSQFVLGIDAMANGIKVTRNFDFCDYNILSIYEFINSLNCLIDSPESYRYYKFTIIELVDMIFDRLMRKALKRINDRPYVEEQILKAIVQEHGTSKHILILDRHAHWNDWLVRSQEGKEIWFVVSPSNRGGYEIHPVPCKYNPNGYRKGCPSKWYGLKTQQLQKVSKVPSASFIHDKKGFIGAAEDLEGAIKLCVKSFCHSENIKTFCQNYTTLCERPKSRDILSH